MSIQHAHQMLILNRVECLHKTTNICIIILFFIHNNTRVRDLTKRCIVSLVAWISLNVQSKPLSRLIPRWIAMKPIILTYSMTFVSIISVDWSFLLLKPTILLCYNLSNIILNHSFSINLSIKCHEASCSWCITCHADFSLIIFLINQCKNLANGRNKIH